MSAKCQNDSLTKTDSLGQSNISAGTFDIVGISMKAPRKISCASLDKEMPPRLIVPLSGGQVYAVGYDPNSGRFMTSEIPANMQIGYDSVIADIDADGTSEIIIATLDGNTVEMFEFKKNLVPNFVQTTLSKNLNYPYGIHHGDINSDGQLDIAIAEHKGNKISLLVNKGGKKFDLIQVSDANEGPQTVKFADMDKDGKPDLVSTARTGNKVYVHFNEGSDKFTDVLVSQGIEEPNYALPYDVDGDSNIDILVASRKSPHIYYIKNNGNRSFDTAKVLIQDVPGTYTILPTDIDQDGDIDFVTPSITDSVVRVHINQNNKSFKTEILDPNFKTVQSVTQCDLDQDGKTELIASGAEANQIRIYFKK